MTGQNSYCDGPATNGASIDGSYPVDTTKLNNLIFLGARWARMPVNQFVTDTSHVLGAGSYQWAALDAAQCIAYTYHQIKPILGLEAGPVQYNTSTTGISPGSVPIYKSAADFGTWCGAVVTHEKSVFPGVTQYSLPGSESNTNPTGFAGGEAQIAAYSKACYAAIKAANPNTFVYGFELNMDGQAGATQFVSDEVALGCKVGTCYDGIAMHFSLRYPVPASTVPCYPNPGGDYSMQCISDIQKATGQSSTHILISETVYTVTGSAPSEQAKADAITGEMALFAGIPTIDGVAYANIDECADYSGFFANGCLIDMAGNHLPAWNALQWMATQNFL